ncbi:MAG: AAA family ATPase, partial [Nanoarchaeota archaeon]
MLGQETVKKQMKSALISGRHMIIVGPPGVGKTTIVRDIAKLLPDVEVPENYIEDSKLSLASGESKIPSSKSSSKPSKTSKVSGLQRFVRVQGSPDLTAEDLIGDIDPMKAMKYGPLSVEAFTPGKIFKANKGILFFDEVNRCSEKLQNSLLQVLEEGKVTIGSYEIDFDSDFIFIGTMNPKDFSTENLSEVFLDRFDLIKMEYPETLEVEKKIVGEKSNNLLDVKNRENSKMLNIIT